MNGCEMGNSLGGHEPWVDLRLHHVRGSQEVGSILDALQE